MDCSTSPGSLPEAETVPGTAPGAYPTFSEVVFSNLVFGPTEESAYGKGTQSISCTDYPGTKIAVGGGLTWISWPVDGDGKYHRNGKTRAWSVTQVGIMRALANTPCPDFIR